MPGVLGPAEVLLCHLFSPGHVTGSPPNPESHRQPCLAYNLEGQCARPFKLGAIRVFAEEELI